MFIRNLMQATGHFADNFSLLVRCIHRPLRNTFQHFPIEYVPHFSYDECDSSTKTETGLNLKLTKCDS